MTIFLIVINFIVDGILLIGLFILHTRIKKAEELEMRQQEIAQEIEGLFSSYLMEIKEENRKMSDRLQERQGEGKSEKTVPQTTKESITPKQKSTPEPSTQTYFPPEPEEDPVMYEVSLQSQILELSNKGYTVEQIAKALNKGKTEIELLLKFNQKN